MVFQLIAAVFLWIFATLLNQNPLALPENKFLNPPPEYIEHFGFGFNDSIADSLWLRWIQDADVCQTYLKPAAVVPEDQKKTDITDLTSVPRHKVCDTSWSFKMLDAVTKLAPKFEMVYLAGASMLAIVVEDYEGSSVLYDRGIEQFPNDWRLLYRAAFHFQFNVHDLPKAADLLRRAVAGGAPNWVSSLASRLYSEAGQLEMALVTLLEFRKSAESNPAALKTIDERLAEIKAKMAK